MKKAPALPATTLGTYCYQSMFSGTGIEETPELPAETVPSYAYASMFGSSPNLKKINRIKAKTVGSYGMSSMFSGSVTIKDIKLEVTSFAARAFDSMFSSCLSLRKIEVDFTAWTTSSVTDAFQNWFQYALTIVCFICPESLPESRGVSRMPSDSVIIRKPDPETE